MLMGYETEKREISRSGLRRLKSPAEERFYCTRNSWHVKNAVEFLLSQDFCAWC